MAAIAAPTTYRAQVRIKGHRRLEATVDFVSRFGRRVVSEVVIRAPSGTDHLPSDGITVEALRSVRLGTVQGEVAEILARAEREGRIPKRLVDGFRERPRPGRRSRDRREYAALCAMYVEHLGSRTPLRDLVHELGPGWTEAGVRALLNRARNFDPPLLTRSEKGKAGGELTDAAKELLGRKGD
jgi:hypothetical protein